ncbi:MAG: outer membrane beta-barrel protein [Alphaproteobacteria bacterium]
MNRSVTSDGVFNTQTPGNLANDPALTPAPPALPALPAAPTPPPPLGGLGDGDDQAVDVAREQGPGITTPAGTPLVGAPRASDNVLDNRPVLPERTRLDPYVPIGMKLGSFLLYAETEVGTILTDNVLGTPIPRSDYALAFAPNLVLQSNWTRHSFTASFEADRSWYKEFPVEDTKTYAAALRGRLDIMRSSSLELDLTKSQTQEGRNSVSLVDIAGFRTSIQQEGINAAAEHTFNRLTLRVQGAVTDYHYGDAGLGIFDPVLDTIIPQQDIRDYREDELRLRASYEFNPRLTTYVEGEISREEYEQPIAVSGITRDSNGFAALSGVTFAFSDALSDDINFGWGEQTSIDDSVGPIEGLLLNANVIWQPTPMTLVEFIARSQVSTTTLVDSLGAIDRFYELSLQQAIWRYLVLGTFVSYEIADYAATPQVDQRFGTGASAEYYFNPYMSVYTEYDYRDFFSNNEFDDFTENRVRIGMRIRR